MIQSDMNEDFTNARPGTQTLFATFWQSVEPYVRQVGEEDLAFLKAWKDEDTGPMSIPPLGPHYQLAWDEEDRLTSLNLPIPVLCSTEPVKKGQANKALEYPKMSKTEAVFDTLQMKEDDLVVEDKGAGPLTERVTSAMMAAREVGDAPIGFGGGMGASGSGSGSGSGNGSGGGDPGPSTLGLGDLERGIKRELQLLGLVGEKEVSLVYPFPLSFFPPRGYSRLDLIVSFPPSPFFRLPFLSLASPQIDWSQRADDEISTSLRQTQRLLAEQASLNESRRSVLLSIAKDRLAFAEYQSCLDGLDRVIDSGWAKRQRSAQRTAKQHNKKGKEKEKHDAAGEGKDGGGGKRVMSEGLRKAIERRERFVQHVGGMFQAEEEESPGRFYGLPKESVYKELMDGIEEGS
jgi:transcriptional adapter 3